ncbi:MAG: sugar ABC transporter permease, partial [Spiroplasma sp.]|nr:sugar ABC transporter permease [Mycoplasmatales bacterium]
MKYKLKSYFFTTIMYLILVIMLVVILFPLLVTVMSAFNATNTLYSTTLIPEMFTLFGNFQRLFEETTYLNWYLNT